MPDRLDLHWLSMRCSRLKPRLVLHSSPDLLQDGSGICFLRYTTDVIILCFGILSWASSVTSWMPMFRIVLSLSGRVSATVFCFVCLLKLFWCCFVLDILLPQTSPKSFVVVLREFRLGALRVLMEHVGSNFYHADGFQNMDGCVKPD